MASPFYERAHLTAAVCLQADDAVRANERSVHGLRRNIEPIARCEVERLLLRKLEANRAADAVQHLDEWVTMLDVEITGRITPGVRRQSFGRHQRAESPLGRWFRPRPGDQPGTYGSPTNVEYT